MTREPLNAIDVECTACLAQVGEPCRSVSSDEERPTTHLLRGLTAAGRLKHCPECNGLGWVPDDHEG